MKKITKYDVRLIKEECKLYEIETNKANSTSAASNIIQTVLDLNSSTVEKFGMLCLNLQLKVIGIHIISIGGLSEAVVDIRAIFQRALLNNANSIIVFHNHPGGSSKPSPEDARVTRKIKNASEIMNIKLIDHLIVYDGGYTSFADRGLL